MSLHNGKAHLLAEYCREEEHGSGIDFFGETIRVLWERLGKFERLRDWTLKIPGIMAEMGSLIQA